MSSGGPPQVRPRLRCAMPVVVGDRRHVPTVTAVAGAARQWLEEPSLQLALALLPFVSGLQRGAPDPAPLPWSTPRRCGPRSPWTSRRPSCSLRPVSPGPAAELFRSAVLGRPDIPRDAQWYGLSCAALELAVLRGQEDLGAALVPQLHPHRDRCAVYVGGLKCTGAVARYVGMV